MLRQKRRETSSQLLPIALYDRMCEIVKYVIHDEGMVAQVVDGQMRKLPKNFRSCVTADIGGGEFFCQAIEAMLVEGCEGLGAAVKEDGGEWRECAYLGQTNDKRSPRFSFDIDVAYLKRAFAGDQGKKNERGLLNGTVFLEKVSKKEDPPPRSTYGEYDSLPITEGFFEIVGPLDLEDRIFESGGTSSQADVVTVEMELLPKNINFRVCCVHLDAQSRATEFLMKKVNDVVLVAETRQLSALRKLCLTLDGYSHSLRKQILFNSAAKKKGLTYDAGIGQNKTYKDGVENTTMGKLNAGNQNVLGGLQAGEDPYRLNDDRVARKYLGQETGPKVRPAEVFKTKDIKLFTDPNDSERNVKEPSAKQKEAIVLAQNQKNRIVQVRGPPGTGKSHLSADIVYNWFVRTDVSTGILATAQSTVFVTAIRPHEDIASPHFFSAWIASPHCNA